jgi:SAM-dependent methyltransferase
VISTTGVLALAKRAAIVARKVFPRPPTRRVGSAGRPEYHYLDGSYEHLERTVVDAREIVPEVLQFVPARSVIDLGCGIGAWLSVFRELGVTDVVGVDGHWVDRRRLRIPAENFLSADLREPFSLAREFDLALSTETAEHLPPESAECFVESLTRLAPVVLFSAALPFVRGNLHINCQWPSYWAQVFRARGYAVTDPIRRRVWTNKKVHWSYSQTMLLFVRNDVLQQYPLLGGEVIDLGRTCLDVVHPEYYLEVISRG